MTRPDPRTALVLLLSLFLCLAGFFVYKFYRLNLLRKSNVIIVTLDTLRPDHLGCFGYPRDNSPFLDELSAKSIVFSNAVSSCSSTVPAHASIFTSLYPEQHRALVNFMPMKENVFTLAEMMKELGYETAGFAAVNFMDKLSGGFDVFDDGIRKWQWVKAKQVVRKTKKWFKQRNAERPFFLWVHLYDAHWPYLSRNSKYYGELKSEPEEDKKEFFDYVTEELGVPADYFGGRKQLIRQFNGYDSEVRIVDNAIRELYECAEQTGNNSDTLWIITTDHGEGLGNHHYRGHGLHIYQEQLKSFILFFSSRGLLPDFSIGGMVRHVDILPTIADIMKFPLKKRVQDLQGESLLPVILKKADAPSAKYAFSQRRNKKPEDEKRGTTGKKRKLWENGKIISLQDNRYKYIYHSQGRDEFYDLSHDPFELHNSIDGESASKDRMKDDLMALYQLMKIDKAEEAAEAAIEARQAELSSLGYIG